MATGFGAVRATFMSSALLSLNLLACSENFWLGEQRYLSAEQASGAVRPRASSYSTQSFYLVRVDQLPALRRPASLTYLGSDERFHYLRVWNKAGRAAEIQFVALHKPDCQVAEEASIESEVAYRTAPFAEHYWRHATVVDHRCVVGPRRVRASSGRHQ